jgi:hypothetical protein
MSLVSSQDLYYDGEYQPPYWQARNPGAKWKPCHGIDDFIKEVYTAGECGSLALVLHEITQWPIFLETDEIEPDGTIYPEYIAHVWVCNPKGQAVDILGTHKENYARTAYTICRGQVLPVKPREVRKIFKKVHYQAWARRIVQHFPHHFGTQKLR